MAQKARNAGRAVVEALADRGVRRFYTVPGESFLEVLDAVDADPRLTLVSCRHESGAAFMAEAEGKLTRRPAVATGTRAVGAANLAIGVQTAFEDSTPMLALLGQVDTGDLGRGAFQEVDLPHFFGPVTRSAETLLRPDRAAEVAARAFAAATSGRGGPAVVALPADVLAGDCPPGAPEQVPGQVAATGPDDATLAAVADLLLRARRPVVVLGSGARDARDEVVALAERYRLGVYTAFRRQDHYPNSHPAYLGHLALGTPSELLAPFAEADVVLALGTRLGDTTTQAFRLPTTAAQVVHVDVEPAAMRAPVRLAWSVRADVRPVVEGLLRLGPPAAGAMPARELDVAAAHAAYLRLTAVEGAQTAPGAGGVHPADVVAALARHLPAETIVTNDAGNFSVFGHRYWRFDHPATQLGPVSGAMGYGVPAAVGAALAAPGRRVLALAGDGGFLMTGQELETAVRYGLPMLVVVFRNGMYGTIAMHQARRYGRTAGCDIGPVDVAGYARALGAAGSTVADATQLDDAVVAAAATALERPTVLEVLTDPDVLVPGTRLAPLLAPPTSP